MHQEIKRDGTNSENYVTPLQESIFSNEPLLGKTLTGSPNTLKNNLSNHDVTLQ